MFDIFFDSNVLIHLMKLAIILNFNYKITDEFMYINLSSADSHLQVSH